MAIPPSLAGAPLLPPRRPRAALAWLVLRNLSEIFGLWTLWAPPAEPHILSAHTTWSQGDVLETDAHWSVAKWNS